MAKRRIYDIAKEKGLASHELLERLQSAGLDVKTSASSVEESEAEKVLSAKGRPAGPKTAPVAVEATRAEGVKPVAAEPPSAVATGGTLAPSRPTARAGVDSGQLGEPKKTDEPGGGERKPPPRPRGRSPRLDNLPTVVGPGVPLRKGVKPPDHVVTKEELIRLQQQRLAEAEAARKAAIANRSTASGEGERPAAPGRPPASRPAPAGRPPTPRPSFAPGRPPFGARPAPTAPVGAVSRPAQAGGKPPRKPGPGREAVERRDRPQREASAPIPDLWAEAAEATGLVAPTPAPGAARVRRGDDKPAKRRVIIDSQAGRKGGRPVFAIGGAWSRPMSRESRLRRSYPQVLRRRFESRAVPASRTWVKRLSLVPAN